MADPMVLLVAGGLGLFLQLAFLYLVAGPWLLWRLWKVEARVKLALRRAATLDEAVARLLEVAGVPADNGRLAARSSRRVMKGE